MRAGRLKAKASQRRQIHETTLSILFLEGNWGQDFTGCPGMQSFKNSDIGFIPLMFRPFSIREIFGKHAINRNYAAN